MSPEVSRSELTEVLEDLALSRVGMYSITVHTDVASGKI
jgi:hypothetical protein